MSPRTLIRDAFTGHGTVTRLAGAALLVTTLASQHPHPAFERARDRDLFSFIPNWKFFAPNPATHDFHYLYRTLDENRETSEWVELELIKDRRMSQAFWFASRRREKAVFDICSAILKGIGKGEDPTPTAPFRVLAAFFSKLILDAPNASHVRGYQFAIVRASGHDEGEEPEVLYVSAYQPLDSAAAKPVPAAA